MTADYIAYHASLRPHAVAIVDNGREISYSELSRQVGKFARALREFGLKRGGWAGVECDDRSVHWLLLLGFEQLGIATLSFRHGETPESLSFLAKADLVLSEHAPPVAGVARRHDITPDWVRSILALPEGDAAISHIGRPDEILRVTLTSGTTGLPKRIALTRRIFEGRVEKVIWRLGLTHRARHLATFPFTVGSAQYRATACLRIGGTVVFESRMEMAQALSAHAINHVQMSPRMLGTLLDRLPPAYATPHDLTITSTGAALSPALRERALRFLASDVREMYSSNEANSVASVNSGSAAQYATVWPGGQVEVVDDGDMPVPIGTTGRIRIRTSTMVDGYLGDPEATLRAFKDGWFYPGDLGILHAPRQLQIVGRADDLINLGGLKLLPAQLEELILREPAVRDAGVCAIRNAAGIPEIWVGIVAELGDAALVETIGRAFQSLAVGTYHIKRLAEIPRNANGKIERAALRSAMTA